jgi:tetratricopeptide (TPR) repeat protein
MFYWNRGRAHFFNNNYPEAITALEKAVELRPNLWHNWLYLISAYTYTEAKPYPKATDCFDRFKTQSPFKGARFTIETLRSHADANPSKYLTSGRDKLYDGLRNVGMDEK